MGTRRAIPTCVLALATLAATCVGQDDAAAFRVFEATWNEAQGFELPPGYVYEWHLLQYPRLDDGALASLNAQAAGKPDHPAHRVILEEERRRTSGADRARRRLYFLDKRNWRYNETNDAESIYVDQVVTNDLIWVLTPGVLTVLSPSSPAPPSRDYAKSIASCASEIGRFRWQDLHRGRGVALRPLRASESRGAVMGVTGATGFEFEYRGRFDTGTFVPDSRRVIASAAVPSAVGETTLYSEFSPEPSFDAPVAHRVVDVDPAGRAKMAYVLREVRTLSSDEFRELSRMPGPSDSDPVRGPSQYTSVVDFRPGAENVTLSSEGSSAVFPLPASELGRPPSSSLRRIGWTGVAIIIAALTGIRVWRSRAVAR